MQYQISPPRQILALKPRTAVVGTSTLQKLRNKAVQVPGLRLREELTTVDAKSTAEKAEQLGARVAELEKQKSELEEQLAAAKRPPPPPPTNTAIAHSIAMCQMGTAPGHLPTPVSVMSSSSPSMIFDIHRQRTMTSLAPVRPHAPGRRLWCAVPTSHTAFSSPNLSRAGLFWLPQCTQRRAAV